MNWLNREVAAMAPRLTLHSGKAVAEVAAGAYRSRFKGRGTAVSEVRAYVPGDAIRAVDWNVTARTGVPHVKVFEEERELVVWLVVDLSGSTAYGSKLRSKAEAAARLAGLIAQSALDAGDRVGVLTFSEGRELVIRPGKGRSQRVAVFNALAKSDSAAGRAGLSRALKRLLELRRRPALVFILSDFEEADADGRFLTAASQRFDVVPIVLRDSAESLLPPGQHRILLEDAETGERLLVNAADRRVRQEVERLAGLQKQTQERLFRSLRMDALWLSPEDDGGRALERMMRRRSEGKRP